MEGQKVNKSLQKSDDGISPLMKLKKITPEDLEQLSQDQQEDFRVHLVQLLNTTKGPELDRLIEKADAVIPKDIKNQLWEINHAKIQGAITNHIVETNGMPTKTHIADLTGLSRATIYKHLKEFDTHTLFKEHSKSFKFMAEQILVRVYKKAMQGEIKAMRLYLEATGYIGQNSPIRNQNNYIQINTTRLTPEVIQQMTPDQLQQIEQIVLTVPAATPLKSIEDGKQKEHSNFKQ